MNLVWVVGWILGNQNQLARGVSNLFFFSFFGLGMISEFRVLDWVSVEWWERAEWKGWMGSGIDVRVGSQWMDEWDS